MRFMARDSERRIRFLLPPKVSSLDTERRTRFVLLAKLSSLDTFRLRMLTMRTLGWIGFRILWMEPSLVLLILMIRLCLARFISLTERFYESRHSKFVKRRVGVWRCWMVMLDGKTHLPRLVMHSCFKSATSLNVLQRFQSRCLVQMKSW